MKRFQRLASLLIAFSMVLSICSPPAYTAWAETAKTPTDITLETPICMIEGYHLSDVTEYDASGQMYSGQGYDIYQVTMPVWTVTYSDQSTEKIPGADLPGNHSLYTGQFVGAATPSQGDPMLSTWTQGNQYTGTINWAYDANDPSKVITGSYKVDVVPNPVTGFTVTGMRDMVTLQAEIISDGNGGQFVYYDPRAAITEMKVDFADGSSETFTNQGQLEEHVQTKYGVELYLCYNGIDQETAAWGVGTHNAVVEFGGINASCIVKIDAAPTKAELRYNRIERVGVNEKLPEDACGITYDALEFVVTLADGTEKTLKHTDVLYGETLENWLTYDNNGSDFTYPDRTGGWGPGIYTCTGASLFGHPVTVDVKVVCDTAVVYDADQFAAAAANPDVSAIHLGNHIDLSNTSTVVLTQPTWADEIHIDLCEWDITDEDTAPMLQLPAGTKVHWGSDAGKPSSNTAAEGWPTITADAPFKVESGAVLELTAGMFDYSNALYTADTAGSILLYPGGLYKTDPTNGSFCRPVWPYTTVPDTTIDEHTWIGLALALDVRADVTTPVDTNEVTAGDSISAQVTVTNISGATLHGLTVTPVVLFDRGPENPPVEEDYRPHFSITPPTGVTVDSNGVLQLGDMAAMDTIALTFTATVPAEWEGSFINLHVEAHCTDVDDGIGTGCGFSYSPAGEGGDGGDGGEGGTIEHAELVVTDEFAQVLGELTDSVLADPAAALASGMIDQDTYDQVMIIKNGDPVAEFMPELRIEPVDDPSILPSGSMDRFEAWLEANADESFVDAYLYDISVVLTYHGFDVGPGKLHNLSKALPLTLKLPGSMQDAGLEIVILRDHGGVVTQIPVSEHNVEDFTVTFASDKFSPYVILSRIAHPATLVPDQTASDAVQTETEAVLADPMAAVENEAISQEAAERISNAKIDHPTASFETTINSMPLTEEFLPEETVTLLGEEIQQKQQTEGISFTQLSLLDITLDIICYPTNDEPFWVGTLDELTRPIDLTIQLPDSFRGIAIENLAVLREHQGVEAKWLDIIARDMDNNTITFRSDKFSTYAVLAKQPTSSGQPGIPQPEPDDLAPVITSPKTGDAGMGMYLAMNVASLAGIALLGKKRRRK